ncbi:MAG: hypothetical protein ABIJ10_01915 [Candidatus Micrarchaeota archaeon]|nr:hypothetical protein [Candidatus Micrarchaeota archaeon]MBU1887343.1 hypothetical protein [Candidatus Micrarchaeota archaeon]
MVNYNPKSNFVKNKIKKTKWENRDYIEILLILEDCILGKRPQGFADAHKIHNIKSEYEKEYLAIFEELDPKGYAKHLKANKKEDRKQKEADRKFKQEEMTDLEKAKESWKKAGGKF